MDTSSSSTGNSNGGDGVTARSAATARTASESLEAKSTECSPQNTRPQRLSNLTHPGVSAAIHEQLKTQLDLAAGQEHMRQPNVVTGVDGSTPRRRTESPRSSPYLGNEQLKAKIQLTGIDDYTRLLAMLESECGSPSKIFLQQEFVLDGANADLWNAGLNLTIRHSTEYYPHHENSPICTVVLKETIFQDLVGLNGEALNMAVINSLLGSDADQSLFYEVKESEEILPLISLAGAVRGGQITPETCGNSRLISRVLSKYYVTGGIHCLGDFANVRHVFQWKGIRLEVDKCKFPHDEGYFVRFDPDDAVALQLFTFLNTSQITYVINLTSKMALFFHGRNVTGQGPSQFLSGRFEIMMPSGNSVEVSLDSLLRNILSNVSLRGSPSGSSALTAGFQPGAADSGVSPIPTAAFPVQHPTAATGFPPTVPSLLSGYPSGVPPMAAIATGMPFLAPIAPVSGMSVPPDTIAPVGHAANTPTTPISNAIISETRSAFVNPHMTQSKQPDAGAPSRTTGKRSSAQLDETRQTRGSAQADRNSNEHVPSQGKRGRKSLVTAITSKVASGEQIDTASVTKQFLNSLNELDVDIGQLDAAAVPAVVQRYQRKRNSEASRRYRQKKTDEINELREQLDAANAEVGHWKAKCIEYERRLKMVPGDTDMNSRASSNAPQEHP